MLRLSKKIQNIHNILEMANFFCSSTVFLLQRICLSEGEHPGSWPPGNQQEQQPRSLLPVKHQPVKTNHKTISQPSTTIMNIEHSNRIHEIISNHQTSSCSNYSQNSSNGNDIEAKRNEASILRHFLYRSETNKLILKL